MRLAASHDADVTDTSRQCALHGRYIELGIVGEDAHGVSWAELGAVLVEHRRRPGDLDLVGHRETAAGGKDLSGVADRHAVAEDLGDVGKCRCEVDCTEDPHLGWQRVGLDEDPDGRLIDQIFRCDLALGAIAPYAGSGGFEFGEGVAPDHPIEFGMAERPDRFAVWLHE